MGICHGWAPAAYMDKRPVRSVVARSPDGTEVNFRPDDIKALSVLKWANGKAVRSEGGRLRYASRFIGGRCNLKDDQIERDPTTGAITNDDCFDTNPGAWHKAMVNQVGIKKRSFVLDVTFDYEVWNQPLTGYRYTYFDPETMGNVATIRRAMKPIGQFTDRFSTTRMNKYEGRAKLPTHVVGVIMQTSYVVETAPTTATSDNPTRDAIRNVRYVYDLEIAADGEILGGEWYENAHPDFLWTPAEGAYAYNEVDENVTSWSPTSAPSNLTQVARQASASNIPLKAVVDGLIEAAQ